MIGDSHRGLSIAEEQNSDWCEFLVGEFVCDELGDHDDNS